MKETRMGAHAKVFGICCIDPRFRYAFEKFLQHKFQLTPTEVEVKTDAGASREIALKTDAGEWILKNALIGYERHGIRIFVLCNHTDCSYYGGSGSFSGFQEESRVYGDDLKKAASILKERLPDIKTLAYIVHKEQYKEGERFVFQEIAV